ncbi:hypothetical protein M427DRAFT_29357 [Gonapodya prolifera JEL478]|uniref:Fe2OG dioxygenase domain-containing protein n=1 Tax=Gonapodya prolifera (strain JEL478) TaxID=1344416 RepID=A0A139AQ77_GONPJ|nr:hypothetical protein M427DRAFT_29357 [Gonapodya prolifera JEL478]|eukprot:KXS18900.1 hypothetical protein M427DRAFT_29357 [Gonapodya prolifera JEL478]
MNFFARGKASVKDQIMVDRPRPVVEEVPSLSPDDPVHSLLHQQLPQTAPPPVVTNLSPPGDPRIALVVDNLVTPQECMALIQNTERLGYSAALLNVGGGLQLLATDVRKSSRRVVDSQPLASALFQRVASYVPAIPGRNIVGLNERLRFLRYDKGDTFRPHKDGNYVRPDGSEHSHLTLQLYLNDDFTGGATTMWFDDRVKKATPGERQDGVVPVTGRIAIFDHAILHEGAIVDQGIKYSMRTDIMYSA